MSFLLDPDVTEELDYYFRTAQVALLGGSNIMFSLQGTSYFANAENEMKTEFNPFTHTWSLGAEEQFYFLFPTIIALAYGQRATQRLPRCLQWAELGPSVSPMRLLAGTAYLSVLFCAYASSTNGMSMVAFYLLPSRFWQMMTGAMLYHAGASRVPPEGTSDSPAKKTMCSSCSLASLMWDLVIVAHFAYAVVRTEGGNGFPFPRSLLAVLAAMGFIWNGSKCPPGGMPLLNRLIGLQPITYVGRVSYPLYLWHWPIFVLTKWSVGLDEPGPRLGALLATVLAAVFTYHGPEALARKWRPKKQRHVFIVALVAVGSLEAVLSCLRIPLRAPQPLTTLNDALTVSLPPPPPLPPPSPPLPSPLEPGGHHPPLMPPTPPPPLLSTCACQNPQGAGHLLHAPPDTTPEAAELCFDSEAVLRTGPHVGDASKPWLWEAYSQCWFKSARNEPFNAESRRRVSLCLTPDRGGAASPKRALFLVGDSHGGSIVPGAEKVATVAGMAFAWIGKGGCGLTGSCHYDDTHNANAYQSAVRSALASQLQPGDSVILLQSANDHIRKSSLDWYESTFIPILRIHGTSLVLILDWPELRYSYCATQPQKSQCFATLHAPGSSIARAQTLAAANNDVYLFEDSRWLFCSSAVAGHDQCGGLVPGTALFSYSDKDHLSYAGGIMFWPFICSRLEEWGLI